MNTLSRREFLTTAAGAGAAVSAAGLPLAGEAVAANRPMKDAVSLAAWSLVRSFRKGKWKNLDLPRICREDFDIDGIEFVNSFFELPRDGYLKKLRKNADDYGVKLVLIMVDGEGDMSGKDKKERMQASLNHRKWIDIAAHLGCHAIRCNVGGPREGYDADIMKRAAESFSHLVDYSSQYPINVILENHGGVSSNPDMMIDLMKSVNSPHFGTLPDFGNIYEFDRYESIRKLVPYAKGISVKTKFNKDGSHPQYDVERLLKICMDEGFHGFWGIEQESREAEDWEAVRWSKAVIDRVVFGKS